MDFDSRSDDDMAQFILSRHTLLLQSLFRYINLYASVTSDAPCNMKWLFRARKLPMHQASHFLMLVGALSGAVAASEPTPVAINLSPG